MEKFCCYPTINNFYNKSNNTNLNIMKNNYEIQTIEINNIINEEKREHFLSLRKKKNLSKIQETRFKITTKDFDIKYLMQLFKELLLIDRNQNEFLLKSEKIIENLQKINITDNNRLKNNIDILSDPIFLEELTEQIYNKLNNNIYNFNSNKKIIINILLIYCSLISIYNIDKNNEYYQKVKELFISKEKYILLYDHLLKNNDITVVYNTYKFIGLLIEDTNELSIMKKLYKNNILNTIINNTFHDNDKNILEIKVWCLSLFELQKEYKNNVELSLSIQKFYITFYNNFLTKNLVHAGIINEKFIYYYIKIISNTSFCNNKSFISNLLNIFEFLTEIKFKLLSNDLLIKEILIIIGNMNSIDDQKILFQIYNTSCIIEYLLNIITNENNKVSNVYLSLWALNNFLENDKICVELFFNKNLFEIYKSMLKIDKFLTESIFNEICISLQYLLNNCNNIQKKRVVIEFNLMKFLIKNFHKLFKIEFYRNLCNNFIELIVMLLTLNDFNLVEYNKKSFENEGGYEKVLDKIMETYTEFKEDINLEDTILMNMILFIKDNLLNDNNKNVN